MALYLKVSNSLENLSSQLALQMKAVGNDVFQQQYVVTQTSGMNNWLKIQIAQRNGIAANIRFVKPNDIIYQVYFKLDGPKEHVLAADNLQWVIFNELDDAKFKRRFPFIANYYKDNDEVKRLGLAQKVADLFDQYQIYRPLMIAEWNQLGVAENTDNWQAYLWIKIKLLLGSRMPDKTVIANYIKTVLLQKENQEKLRDRLPQIFFFGISILTSFHIELFQQLAEFTEIHFFLLNPAPNMYWYDDRSPEQIARWMKRHEKTIAFAPPLLGNTLLTNWGRVIQDTFNMFFRQESNLNQYDDSNVVEPDTHNLLGKIQFDLFNNATKEERQIMSAADIIDGSVTFNACYTPAREVEVLYNYLVRLVENQEHPFSPRDIVVMVNDIDTYAPYIRAIFGSAPFTFPFTIADEHMDINDGFFNTLRELMNFDANNFRAEALLQLLDLAFVRQRFGITNPSIIRKVVNAANIRFGINGSEEDESITLSLVNGLKRVMYGICMSSQEEYFSDGYGFFPLDVLEGAPALELIRFTHFVQVLIDVILAQDQARTLKDWSIYLDQSVAQLLLVEEDQNEQDYIIFRQYLERLNLLSETMPEKISFQVFRQSFINEMSSETLPGNFISGGITFCSLIPMRSIPFKVVALLGLNYDKFPRKESPVTFDLIKANPQRGDRDVRENDKHLFLETIISAREHLYISYIGRNARDNSVLPPSALVDELLDYLKDGVEKAGLNHHKWITTHPLHSFSSLYANPHSGYHTYLIDSESEVIVPILSIEPDTKSFDFEAIDISKFIAFFKNPFKAYYNNVLGVYYKEDEVLLSDTEVFESDYLQLWQLKQDLLFLNNDELADYRNKGVKTGLLPLKHMADLLLEQTKDEVAEVREMVQEFIGDHQQESVYLEVEIAGKVFSGNLTRIYGNRNLVTSFSKRDKKYCIEAYITHLLIIAAGLPLTTHYISGAHLLEKAIPQDYYSQTEAIRQLSGLIEFYKSGHVKPLIFLSEFMQDSNKLGEWDAAQFRRELKKALIGDYAYINDPYILKEYDNGFFDSEEVFEEYRILSAAIYGPVQTLFNR